MSKVWSTTKHYFLNKVVLNKFCSLLASYEVKPNMKKLYQVTLPLLLTLLLFSGGCATTSTLSRPVHERKPLVMSGTRLNLASIRNEAAIPDKFGVPSPSYPLLDLPFSTFFDLIVLPYTVPAALLY